MPYQGVVFPSITIPLGSNYSGALAHETVGALKTALRACRSLVFFAPLGLTGVITVQVSKTEAPTTANDWYNLTINGVVVTVPVGSATEVNLLGYRAVRLKSSQNETSDRVFGVNGQVLI